MASSHGFIFSVIPTAEGILISKHSRNQTKTNMSNVGPPRPTSIDIVIGCNLGSTVALDATPARLQASKRAPKLSQSQEIERLVKENGCLRQELAYQHKMHEASKCLAREAKDVVERLQRAVLEFRKVQKETDYDFDKGAASLWSVRDW